MKFSFRMFLVIFVAMTTVSLWLLIKLRAGRTYYPYLLPSSRTFNDDISSNFLTYTSACRIPYMDPFDPSIQKFIFDEEDTKCAETYGMALVESNITSLYVNESALAYYNITDINDLRCCYTPFWRVEVEETADGKYPVDVDSHIRYADTCIQFIDPVEVTDEFVKIECFSKSAASNNSIYTDYHAFTPVRNNTINVHPYNDPLIKNSASVIALGLDTLSRLNLHRQMPLTAEFIKTRLHGVELLGYNKVADNTFPNVIPVLTGHFHEELTKSCWPTGQSVFDNCNFIWDRFRDVGHTTYFSEDAPSIGGIFSYLYRGFRKQPTDYYPRPFNSQAEAKIAFNRRKESKLCVGPRTCLQVILNNALKFETTMKDILSFSFVWSSCLTHDFFNLPKLADADITEFLESLLGEGVFERSILVILSDHGMRWGDVRQTYQGYFEERLPLLYIAYPVWFGQKFTTAIRNLKGNAHKLTTPFDLHETLIDLTNLVSIEKESLNLRSQELVRMKNLPRGISLFLPIPDSRTCKDAGIVDHWCTCHESESVSNTDAALKRAADFLVVHINSLISDYPRCARLRLQQITNSREEKAISHKKFQSSDSGLRHFSVTIETVPGNALFESTVRYNGNTNNFSIVGTVSRTNLYGNQSSCISHFMLRLYCYCT